MSGDKPPTGKKSPAEHPHEGSPSWKPYRSPEAKRGSILRLLRRYAFPITLVATVLAVGSLIYFAPERLAPAPTAGESASVDRFSSLSVYSQPAGARVIVEDDTIGTTPLKGRRFSTGTYFVSVMKEDYEAQDTVLTLSADQPTVYTPRLSQEADLRIGEGSEAGPEPQSPSTTENFRPEPSSDRLEDNPPDEAPTQASNQESSGGGPPAVRPDQGASQEQESSPASSPERDPDSLATGRLALRSDPENATVELNGHRVGTTPVRLDQVATGTHEVTFAHTGYDTVTRRVEVTRGETVTVNAALTAQTGYLRVLARPWGSIYINDERRVEDADVWYETELQAGTHTVTARHPVLGSTERNVEVAPRDTQSVVLDLREN